jgi:hypothetical protein
MRNEFKIKLPRPHYKQSQFIDSPAKRIVVRAGRRGGKTVGVAVRAVESFLRGKRILYGAPTADQLQSFWFEIKRALAEPIEAGIFVKNETDHSIELAGTKQRIRAKTAYNADTLRGDYADELILDEYQLMNEETWGVVGAPMLMDNDGNAIFIYTPPSLSSRSVSKADDPQHAAKLFKRATLDTSGRWQTFHFKSLDNPYIDANAVAEMAQDMTALAYRMEIEAEDVDEAPGAYWTRKMLDDARVLEAPDFQRVLVGVDPSATSGGDEAGIVVAGRLGDEAYVVADYSLQGSPRQWASRAVAAYYDFEADCIIAESNNGGEMVALTIKTVDPNVKVKLVHASRGKLTRAEPIASIYEHGRCHHVGHFPQLEDQMCLWMPGDPSPDRMDAMVWCLTELMEKKRRILAA